MKKLLIILGLLTANASLHGQAKRIFYEFKSVRDIPSQHFARQFINDLNLPGVESLEQIKWIFDGKKVSNLNKVDFINELKNAEISMDEIGRMTTLFNTYTKTNNFISMNHVFEFMQNNVQWFNEIFKIK
jgi:hypothetical protein